jgi:hypothetical protein
MSDMTSAAPATAPSTLTSTPAAPPPVVEPHTKAGISPAEAATMQGWIKADLASGRMTQAQAEKAFDELQTPPEARSMVDTRSEEQKALDAEFPAAKPHEYLLRFFKPGEPGDMTPALNAGEQASRTWLSEAGFPRELGNTVVNTITKVLEHTKSMNADQLEYYGAKEFEKLQAAYGDTLEARLEQARLMVQALEAKAPGLNKLLKSNGIGDNALVASLLMQQAERWHLRNKR